MTSPFKRAEFVGGPLDGSTYERIGDRFPTKLQIEVDGYVYGYVARINELGGVVYRFTGRLSVVEVK
jgi:hypothetical protein